VQVLYTHPRSAFFFGQIRRNPEVKTHPKCKKLVAFFSLFHYLIMPNDSKKSGF